MWSRLTCHLLRPAAASEAVSQRAMSSLRPPPSQMSNMMDIGSRRIFNEDHDIFRESARRWYRDVLAPQQLAFEEAGKPTREAWAAMGEQGLLGLSMPEEAGGHGGTFLDETIAIEEAIYAGCASPAAPLHSAIVLPYFVRYGSEEQIKKYVPDLVSGKRVLSIGMTEPDAGSDLQGIRTNAKPDGEGGLILNGSKIYITNGIVADTHVIVAITDATQKHKAHGISLLIVEDGMPGFRKGRNLQKLGLKGGDTAELFFEDVRVPKENVLGSENAGFYQLMQELPQERLVVAVMSAAVMEFLFEHTRQYVQERKAFGRTISSLQVTRHKMAELKSQISACRAFVDDCIELHANGMLTTGTASMAKQWCSDLENKVAAECLQMHGGWGFMWENPVAKAYANARVQTIYGGSNEIMKELVSRDIFPKQ